MNATAVTPRQLFQVAQFSKKYPAFAQAAIRVHILNATDRFNSRGEKVSGNGLAEAGGIVRVGRRVLIDEEAFFRWIATLQTGQCSKERPTNVRQGRVQA